MAGESTHPGQHVRYPDFLPVAIRAGHNHVRDLFYRRDERDHCWHKLEHLVCPVWLGDSTAARDCIVCFLALAGVARVARGCRSRGLAVMMGNVGTGFVSRTFTPTTNTPLHPRKDAPSLPLKQDVGRAS